MNVKRVKFEHEGVSGVVRGALGIDDIDRAAVALAVFPQFGVEELSRRDSVRVMHFASLLLQTEQLEGHDFAWASPSDADERIQAAYTAFCGLSSGLMRAWRDALDSANTPFLPDDTTTGETEPENSSSLTNSIASIDYVS